MDKFFGESEMANVVRNKDWSKTPLGPIESWSESLKTTVSLCLNSNSPISLAWGPEFTQIYNDGYWPICGDKHPHSMSQNFKECWAAPWPIIGEVFEQALAGKASYIKDQRMFLERFGYVEETFFTFSFSPIIGASGTVEGLFHPVTEVTEKMLSERRGRILRELPAQTSKAQTMEEVANLTIPYLSTHSLDLPFALIYFFDQQGGAFLIRSTGLPVGTSSCVERIIINNSLLDQWPLHELKNKTLVEIDNLDKRFGSIICDPYPEAVKKAIMLPIVLLGHKDPHGVLITGVSPRRALDEAYLTFYEMLGAGVTTAMNTANAYEEEKKRAEALAEIDRAKTTFFNNISHEFRTPLTLMLSPLEGMLFEADSLLPQVIRSDIEVVYRNCTRLLKLVNNLLDFSRLESHQVEALFEPVHLNELTTDFASSFLEPMEKAGLKSIVQCDNLKERVYVDKSMWEKIVLNLLSNAFKYTLQGTISLTLKDTDYHVELTVHDTGVGIPSVELQKIFDRFHRIKGSKGRTHEGTGIGLALVSELVKLHGGTIRVESEVNVGSSFIVTIPFGAKHLPADQIRENISTEHATDRRYSKAFIQEAFGLISDDSPGEHLTTLSTTKNKFPERIIFAEDNADMRGYVSRLLSDYYQVTAFVNGKEALDAIIANPPDIILSDVMMPVMNGVELIKEVRRNKRIASIPIILLSARAGQESVIAGIESGADDYLVKPFSTKELLVRLKQQIAMVHLRQETNKLKDEFLTNMSHELRTPLNAIVGFGSLMLSEKMGSLSFKQKEFMNQIANSSSYLLHLVNDLLDITKIESGKIELKSETIDLASTTNEVISIVKNLADEKNITLEVQINCQFATIVSDSIRLKQVLYNYLSNAIKFTPRDGRIILNISPYKMNFFRIDLKDTGPGIKEEDFPKLFTKFQQFGSDVNTKTKGTGLGLALSKRIVEALGGTVEVRSSLGEGSTFSAILPRDINNL